MSKNILIIHGPNLNLLGQREPEIYGFETLDDVNKMISDSASLLDATCQFYQSNHEGELIDRIQESRTAFDGLIINAGAFTHTSIAIADALRSVKCPIFEVHISNVHSREEFRHNSYISAIAKGVIVGCGTTGYLYALESLLKNS